MLHPKPDFINDTTHRELAKRDRQVALIALTAMALTIVVMMVAL